MNVHPLLLRISVFFVLATALVPLQAKEDVAAPTVISPTPSLTTPEKTVTTQNTDNKPTVHVAPEPSKVQASTPPAPAILPEPIIPEPIDSLKPSHEQKPITVGYTKSNIPFKDWLFSNGTKDAPLLMADTHSVPGMVGAIPEKVFWFIDQLKQSDISTPATLFQQRLILYGPPGNGKTTLAGIIAREADCGFIKIWGSRIITTYQGQGSESIQKDFERAAKLATEIGRPVVIFFDEIDAIARENTLETRGEQQAALQTLWLCLDEYKEDSRICFICATNHFYRLDKTFLDRFGINTIEIGNPDAESRKAVVEFYMNSNRMQFAPELIKDIVKKTTGYSCRSIEGVVKTVVAVLAHRTDKTLQPHDLDKIIEYNNTRDINKQHGEEEPGATYEGFTGYLQKVCDKIYYWTNWPKVESMAQKFLLASSVILNFNNVKHLLENKDHSPFNN